MDPNNGEVVVDPNNGDAVATEDEVGLGHSKNIELSNNDEFKISFQGAQNSSCHITIKIQARNVSEWCEVGMVLKWLLTRLRIINS